jgi:hypothetical protein
MRARDFIKNEDELSDQDKDTWAGGGTEFSPNWTQQIGIAGGQEAGTGGGQGFQRAQGNLPGGVNLGIAADYSHPEGNFAHQRGINVGYGPANITFGEKGALGAGVNVPAGKGNLNLNVSGNQNKGVQGVGAQYSIGDPETKGGAFNIGVNKPSQGDPSFYAGYSAKFEEDAELDEMAGEFIDEAHIDAHELVDVYIRGRHRGETITRLVVREFPNQRIPALIEKLVTEYNINPNSIIYGPSRTMKENFADGKNPGRKGLSRRVGIPKKATLGQLEKIAKSSTGERQRMAQWQLNMRRGKQKKNK